MVKKLQRRFILLAIASVSFVFVAIIGILLGSNYYNIVAKSETTITELYDYYEVNGYESIYQTPPDSATFPDESDLNQFLDDKSNRGPEGVAGARYFMVVIEDDAVVAINTDHIAAINDSAAATMGLSVLTQDQSGSFDSYRYMVFDDGTTQVVIFLDVYLEMQTFSNFLSNSFLLGLVGLVLFTVIAWVLSRIAIKPVAESIMKQKQFITDASHELKTPLTVISANNEMIELDYGENGWSQAIDRQITKMTVLTNSLVKLARLDEEIENVKMENFRLDELIDEIGDEYQDLALVQNKELTISSDPINFRGDPALIKQLLEIGLDNAFKYTGEAGKIEIILSKPRKTQIIIKNNVSQIDIGEFPELFDRFTRLDKSRNSRIGGYGIGLAIAKSIVIKHHGKIKAYSDDGKHFVLKIEL